MRSLILLLCLAGLPSVALAGPKAKAPAKKEKAPAVKVDGGGLSGGAAVKPKESILPLPNGYLIGGLNGGVSATGNPPKNCKACSGGVWEKMSTSPYSLKCVGGDIVSWPCPNIVE